MGFTSLFNRVAAGATAALPLGRPPRQPPTGAPPPPAINPQDVALPQDSLPADSLVPQFLGHFGVPDNADKLAYDPHQRLLAVSCTDGRVKVYGGEGAEVLFCSPSHTATRQLLFLPHRLAVLRIAEDGLVEAFSLIAPYQRTAALHDLADTDPPHCAVSLPMEDSQDVILLGCASGAMRMAQASAAPYGNRTTSLQIRALRLMPYCVGPRDWCDAKVEGPLLALEPQPRNETDCVMVVHGDGLIVWSLSHGGAAASVHRTDGGTDMFADVGDLHAGCWAASDASLAASAHSNGDVLVWALPSAALPGAVPPPGSLPRVGGGRMVVTQRLRVTSDTFTSAITAVRLLREGTLLVQGGQSIEQPEGLSLLHIPPHKTAAAGEEAGGGVPEEASSTESESLPWFGAIHGFQLLPTSAGESEVGAALVLSEHGQLILYSLQEKGTETRQFPLSSQKCGTVTALEWLQHHPVAHVSSLECDAPRSKGLLALTVDDLPTHVPLPETHVEDGQVAASSPGRGAVDWSWVVSGGEGGDPPQGGSGVADMLATGHSNGCCLLWDTRSQVPLRRGVVSPVAADAASHLPAPVSCVALCWEAGLLAVGHADGRLRLYQWHSRRRQVAPLTVDLHGMRPGSNSHPSGPGFHLVMEAAVHAAALSAIALGTGYHLMAFGDSEGKVSVFDLGRGAFLFMLPVSPGSALVQLHFGTLRRGTNGARAAAPPSSPPSSTPLEDVALYCLAEDFTATVVDCAAGRVAAQSGSGQKRLKGISLDLLDCNGVPQPPPTGHVRLVWAEVVEEMAEARARAAPAAQPTVDATSGGSVEEGADELDDVAEEVEDAATTDGAEVPDTPFAPVAGGLAEKSVAQQAAETDEVDVKEESDVETGVQRDGDSDSDSELLEAAAAAVEAKRGLGGRLRSTTADQKIKGLIRRVSSTTAPVERRIEDGIGKFRKVFRRSATGGDEDSEKVRAAGDPTGHSAHEATDISNESVQDAPTEVADAAPAASLPVASSSTGNAEPSTTSAHSPSSPDANESNSGDGLSSSDDSPSKFKSHRRADDSGGSSITREPSVAVFEVKVKELWTAFLLLASDHRIEVCRPFTSAGPDRAALAEVNLKGELLCRSARAFTSAGHPGLAVLTTSNQLLVYSLPRLTSLLAVHMEYCLGWPFGAPSARSPRAVMGPEGQLAIATHQGEMFRLALSSPVSLASPKAMSSVAEAETAHGRAVLRMREALQQRQQTWLSAHESEGGQGSEAAEGATGEDEAADVASSDSSQSRGHKLPAFLGGLEKLGGDLLKNLRIPEQHRAGDKAAEGELPVAIALRPIMSLEARFSREAEGVDQTSEIESDLELDDSTTSLALSDEAGSGRAPRSPPAPRVAHHAANSTGARITSAAPPPATSAAPQVRTSEEIKKLYGRKTNATSSVMADNVKRMEERGERLSRLQDKTATMENDARNFAEMATKLAEQSGAGKKWWQL